MGKILYTIFIVAFCLPNNLGAQSQDKRAQYPGILLNSYFSVNVGYTAYSFSEKQLEPGYTAEAIHIPHGAIRILFGHQFNPYLSAQLSYMRPFAFVEYKNVNGSGKDYEVGMNVAGLTIKSTLPVSKKISVQAEAGMGVITRGGFIVINAPGVKDVVFISLLLGGGFEYQLNKNWSLSINTIWSPAHEKVNQPVTVFCSAGFNYTMRKLSPDKVARNTGFIFPKKTIQLGTLQTYWVMV